MIDNKIIYQIKQNKKFIDIFFYLQDIIDDFSNREDFMNVSESHIIQNWNFIPVKKRYITYYVICLRKKKSDIMWLVMNKDVKLKKYSNLDAFGLIQLRSKLCV